MTVTTVRKFPVKKDDLENEDLGKEKGLEKWQLSLIVGVVTFSILLIIVLVICKVDCDSKKRAIKRVNNNHGATNQLQPDNSVDNVIVNNYARHN